MPRVASQQGRQRTADVATDETVRFADLMLSEATLRGLHDSGFERPSPIQLQAIPVGLFGTDLIAQAKSGTGKTCVFTVVALESVRADRPVPQVVALAPTREIAVQIGHVFSAIGSHHSGLAVEVLIGGMAIQRDRERLRSCNVVVGTPGRVGALLAEGSLPSEAVRLLVLDEADKLMDDIFAQDLEYIVGALPQRKQILALSATYTTEQRDLLTGWMRDPTMVLLDADSVSLRGVAQRYWVVGPLGQAKGQYGLFEGKATALLQLLGMTAFHQCLVFLNGRARAHDLVATLNHHGYPAAFISGDLPQQQRNAAMASMRSLQLRVLVSTDLTARGVDVERVNLVINLDLPRCAETYIHRVGRTGRFGTHGLAIALVGSDELPILLEMVRSLNSLIEPVGSQFDRITAADALSGVSTNADAVSSNGNDKDEQQHTNVGVHSSAELGSSSVGLAAGTEVGTGAGAGAADADTGVLLAQACSVEDEAAAAQLERLKKLREQAAAKEPDALELRRHQKAAGRSFPGDSRPRHQRSKARDFHGCGVRVSFSDGSAITEADATDLPDLFRQFGEIQSTQFRIGKTHGWVDFVDTSTATAIRVCDAINDYDGSINARQLVVQPWANGSAVSIMEGSDFNPTAADSTVHRPRTSTQNRKRLVAECLPSLGSTVWAKYTVDGLWYQAEVTEFIQVGGGGSQSSDDEDVYSETEPESSAERLRVAVTYVGYNNFEVLPLSSIWQGAPEPEPEPDSKSEPKPAFVTQAAPEYLSSLEYASSRAEAMCESCPRYSHQALGQRGATGLGNVCYGHPWYIDRLVQTRAAQHNEQVGNRASQVPIAPFPFPCSTFEDTGAQCQRQWQWRWRWPSPPPAHW